MNTLIKTNLRDVWQAYQAMNNLLDALPAHTRQVVEKVLAEGVTPEVVYLADDAPEDEWQRYQILRIIVGANPEHPEYATDVVLDEIRIGLEDGALS
jgi:hypothetical protein